MVSEPRRDDGGIVVIFGKFHGRSTSLVKAGVHRVLDICSNFPPKLPRGRRVLLVPSSGSFGARDDIVSVPTDAAADNSPFHPKRQTIGQHTRLLAGSSREREFVKRLRPRRAPMRQPLYSERRRTGFFNRNILSKVPSRMRRRLPLEGQNKKKFFFRPALQFNEIL